MALAEIGRFCVSLRSIHIYFEFLTIVSLKRFSFSVGVHTIAFRTVGATCGVGIKL